MGRRTPLRLMPARLLWIVAGAALVASTVTAVRRRPFIPAQAPGAPELAAGKILVARRNLLDPNFAQTVILLVQYDEDGTVGLIINRQTKVPLSRLSKEIESAKGKSDPLYAGGPVETSGLLALFRSRTKPEDARHVAGDVYVISTKAALEKTIAAGAAPSTFRLYLGYAGWDAEQLEWEIGMDSWNVLPANAGMVFDAHPETLWSRLVEQEGMQIARLSEAIEIRSVIPARVELVPGL